MVREFYIRRSDPDKDVAGLAQLELDVWGEVAQTKDWVEHHLRCAACHLVAHSGDRLVGYIYGYEHSVEEENGFPHRWVLNLLGVHPDFRNRKIGRGLVQRFESYAIKAGKREVEVDAEVDGLGLNLYQHMGFDVIEDLPVGHFISTFPGYKLLKTLSE